MLTTLSAYTCLGCNDPLPTGRGGHCDACVEWDADDEPTDDIEIQYENIPYPNGIGNPDALADDPPPTPPVDDGPADNWGGFRAAVPDGQDADDFSDVGPERCKNCGGAHFIQKCPEIAAALRADAPDAGRAIGRQWLRDRTRFLTMLANLDRDAWQLLAAAYCAWMNRGGCGLEVAHVVLIWTKAVERDIALPPKAA